MKPTLYIIVLCLFAFLQPCSAQNDDRHENTDTYDNGIDGIDVPGYDKGTIRMPGDTAFFPRIYAPAPYYIGDWQLHSGLNAQLGTSVTVGFGKHAPHGVGIGTHAAFLYAAPLSKRLSVAAGIGTQTFDWGGFKIRDVELMGIAAYQVNDFINVYAYGSKSLMKDRGRCMYRYPNFGKDRFGGAVDFNLSENFSIQFGVEQTRYR